MGRMLRCTKTSEALSSGAILLGLILALVLSSPARALAQVQPMQATLAQDNLSEFSQTNAVGGSLQLVQGGYGSPYAAQASYTGDGQNGYARGIFNVDWSEGDDVWYGAAFYLPSNFRDLMQGQVALMRWDNWPSYPNDCDQGGIVINEGDKLSYLERDHQNPDGSWSQTDLTNGFELPYGRWFWLEVHQRFESATGAVNEVYIDGQRVASSTESNMFGRGIERIRYGIVAIAAGDQDNSLSLDFGRATVATGEVGPIPGLTGPVPQTEPLTPQHHHRAERVRAERVRACRHYHGRKRRRRCVQRHHH